MVGGGAGDGVAIPEGGGAKWRWLSEGKEGEGVAGGMQLKCYKFEACVRNSSFRGCQTKIVLGQF